MEATDAALALVDTANESLRICWAGPSFGRLLFGDERAEVVGTPLALLVPVGGLGPEGLLARVAEGREWAGEVRLSGRDGRLVPVTLHARPLPGERVSVLSANPVSDLVSPSELAASEGRFHALAMSAPVAVVLSEGGLRLGFANAQFHTLTGLPTEEVPGTGWLDAFHAEDTPELLLALTDVLEGEETQRTVRLRTDEHAERERWVHLRLRPVELPGRGSGFVGTVEDVTDARRHEAELLRQARHDSLTGLPNRVHLIEQIEAHLSSRDRTSAALLFFDLDNFKPVNDSLGHGAGDELLRTIAARLATDAQPDEVVARLGGDEFVLFAPTVSSAGEAMLIAERVAGSVQRPVVIGGQVLRPTASIGVVLSTPATTRADELLRDADLAMYEAKRGGRATTRLFERGVRS